MKNVASSKSQILLHVCCAPCSCTIIERLLKEQARLTLFFYNPNIYPREEYEHRKDSVVQFAKKRDVPFVDADYDNEDWLKRVQTLKDEPERGKRCSVCFDMRLEKAALYAHDNDFRIFATTNGIARWKDMEQVDRSAMTAAARYPDLIYLKRNWRQGNALGEMTRISAAERFYKQEYCGCLYSLLETNKRRESQGKPRIIFGQNYYGIKQAIK